MAQPQPGNGSDDEDEYRSWLTRLEYNTASDDIEAATTTGSSQCQDSVSINANNESGKEESVIRKRRQLEASSPLVSSRLAL